MLDLYICQQNRINDTLVSGQLNLMSCWIVGSLTVHKRGTRGGVCRDASLAAYTSSHLGMGVFSYNSCRRCCVCVPEDVMTPLLLVLNNGAGSLAGSTFGGEELNMQ